jgi:hypothetical protein
MSSNTQGKNAPADFQIARDGWLKMACQYPCLSGADMAMLVTLSLHLNRKTGTAWPSIGTISKLTNRAPSTISRSIKRLEKLGLIRVVHGRGPRDSNRYRPGLGLGNATALRRRHTSLRGKVLRTRNEKTANPKQ